MSRKPSLEVVQREGVERLVVAGVSRVAVLAPPWILLIVLFGVGAASHALWGAPPAAMWTTMAATLITAALTGLTWLVSHHRSLLGRWHSTLTVFGAGLWFAVANITGVTSTVTSGLWFFFGAGLALAWNIRTVIRQVPGEGGTEDPLRALLDGAKAKVSGLEGATVKPKELTEHKATADIGVPAGKTVDDLQKRLPALEAAAHVPPGSFAVTPDRSDAGNAHFSATDPRVMDAHIPWPGPSRPGGSIAEPLRIGLFADSMEAEPIIIGNNLQIMGASGSGKSIGGTWNLLAEAITRRDVAVFGIDLSKGDQTLGPFRPAMARFETTPNGASQLIRAIHAEMPKRTQWLTEHGYTDWEEDCGLTYWLVVVEEASKTFAKLSDKTIENLDEIAKEIRSAGGRLILSLQKSIFNQISTVARSQMSFMCFGLNDSGDATYGLSERQIRQDVDPSLWGAGRPEHQGKAYIDVMGVPETHIAMPLRTYSWGPKSQASAAMTEYVAQWPLASKDLDEFTARLAQGGSSPAPPPVRLPDLIPDMEEEVEDEEPEVDEEFAQVLALAAEVVIAAQHATTAMLQRKLRLSHDECLRVLEALERKGVVGPHAGDDIPRRVLIEADDAAEVVDRIRDEGDPVAAVMRTPDPDPELAAGAYDEIPDLPADDDVEVPSAKGAKLSTAAARGLVEDWIRHRHAKERPSFEATDPELRRIRQEAGMTSRSWINNTLDRYERDGVLEKHKNGTATVYTIVDLARLDRLVPA